MPVTTRSKKRPHEGHDAGNKKPCVTVSPREDGEARLFKHSTLQICPMDLSDHRLASNKSRFSTLLDPDFWSVVAQSKAKQPIAVAELAELHTNTKAVDNSVEMEFDLDFKYYHDMPDDVEDAHCDKYVKSIYVAQELHRHSSLDDYVKSLGLGAESEAELMKPLNGIHTVYIYIGYPNSIPCIGKCSVEKGETLTLAKCMYLYTLAYQMMYKADGWNTPMFKYKRELRHSKVYKTDCHAISNLVYTGGVQDALLFPERGAIVLDMSVES